MSELKIEPNRYVVLDYALYDETGEMVDSSKASGGPIMYVHGYGALVPGLEAAVVGLRKGDQREIVVAPEEAFGDHDDSLVFAVERTEFPDPKAVAVGDEFMAESEDGTEVPMRVVKIEGDDVVVDANHPLAGVTIKYAIKVLEVRDATADEIAEAAAEFEEAEGHIHGPDCHHEHEEPLIALGAREPTKKN